MMLAFPPVALPKKKRNALLRLIVALLAVELFSNTTAPRSFRVMVALAAEAMFANVMEQLVVIVALPALLFWKKMMLPNVLLLY
jgi:hypothetical protein